MSRLLYRVTDAATAFVHAVAALVVLYLLASLILPGDHGPVGAAIVLALAVIGADVSVTWPLGRATSALKAHASA